MENIGVIAVAAVVVVAASVALTASGTTKRMGIVGDTVEVVNTKFEKGVRSVSRLFIQ